MTLAQENSILSLIGTDPDGLLPQEICGTPFPHVAARQMELL
jgi:hypothetical protein